MTSERQGPIFVVGASRSGTALVRSILNNHASVHLAGETHYFDDLRPRVERANEPLTEAARRETEDYFLRLSHRPYGHGGDPERASISRAELREEAQRLGEGTDAYFEAHCRMDEGVRGRPVWGEKTPRHVYRLGEILSRYPDARAICMVRDPRAMVASYRDWKNQGGFDLDADPDHARKLAEEQARTERSYHIVLAALLWRGTVSAAVAAKRRFGADRVRIQRYEDLAIEPESAVRGLVEWLGLRFDPALLEVPMHNSSVAEFSRASGVSTAPVERWRSRLSKGEIGVIEWWAGAAMRDAGYERSLAQAPLGALATTALSIPFALARAVAANRRRVPNLPQYVWRRLRLAIGTARGG